MYGGLITNGSYVQGEGIESVSANGGNINAQAGSQLNILGGVISGGKAVNGGNIYIETSSLSVVNINGGTISGGNATNGGNIVSKANNVTIGEYALIKDGVAAVYGGNIQLNGGTLTTSGHIMNGKAATAGGNIDVKANTLIINGGVIANGTITNATGGACWGGNIRCWNGHVTMNDGLVYGGTRIAPDGNTGNIDANNIGVKGEKSATPSFTMTGGTVVGDIGFSQFKAEAYEVEGVKKDYPGTAVKISGNAKIVTSLEIEGKTVTAERGITIGNGNQMDVSELTAEAKIAVTGTQDKVLTKSFDGIAALKGCFTLTNADADKVEIALNETDKTLYVVQTQVEAAEENGLVKFLRNLVSF
jgi:filamentous hemagglutinin